MRHALVVAARRVGSFRVVQLSIQRDHVHLIVEALDVTGQPWPVSPAQTWLLTIGWRRHGPIATTEVPG